MESGDRPKERAGWVVMGNRWRYSLASVTDGQPPPARFRQHNPLRFGARSTKEARERADQTLNQAKVIGRIHQWGAAAPPSGRTGVYALTALGLT